MVENVVMQTHLEVLVYQVLQRRVTGQENLLRNTEEGRFHGSPFRLISKHLRKPASESKLTKAIPF